MTTSPIIRVCKEVLLITCPAIHIIEETETTFVIHQPIEKEDILIRMEVEICGPPFCNFKVSTIPPSPYSEHSSTLDIIDALQRISRAYFQNIP